MPPKELKNPKDNNVIIDRNGIYIKQPDGSTLITYPNGSVEIIPADPEEAGKYTKEPEDD